MKSKLEFTLSNDDIVQAINGFISEKLGLKGIDFNPKNCSLTLYDENDIDAVYDSPKRVSSVIGEVKVDIDI